MSIAGGGRATSPGSRLGDLDLATRTARTARREPIAGRGPRHERERSGLCPASGRSRSVSVTLGQGRSASGINDRLGNTDWSAAQDGMPPVIVASSSFAGAIYANTVGDTTSWARAEPNCSQVSRHKRRRSTDSGVRLGVPPKAAAKTLIPRFRAAAHASRSIVRPSLRDFSS